ncbi:MAG: hypothetical protein K2X09_04780 [Rickettsiales bacterium]|nr:hypothetical protein [Rickettsiales bacterium]
MPWISQMLGFAILLVGIAIALWVSFWLLLVVFIIGIAAVIWSHLRGFLLAKGILSPRFAEPRQSGDSMDGEEEGAAPLTIIEGDYKRVDSE